MPFLFQGLRVYQQALAFADDVATLTAGFSRSSWHIRDQLNRASLSIALNIAESTGRGSSSDKRRFLVMARGSVHECAALFDMCQRRKLIPDTRRAELTEHLTTISKMLSGMIDRYTGDGVREEGEE
ncbi:MAG: four helix bundle protein [Armatimonadota bacterium]